MRRSTAPEWSSRPAAVQLLIDSPESVLSNCDAYHTAYLGYTERITVDSSYGHWWPGRCPFCCSAQKLQPRSDPIERDLNERRISWR